MPERSQLRQLIDRFAISGHDKAEIDALLTDMERSAKAMGAYEAGRDHATAIAQLVEKNDRLQKAVDDARRWLAKLHPKCRRLGSGAEGRCPVCRALDATVAAPAADTPETVAEKAKMARAVGDRFAEMFGKKEG